MRYFLAGILSWLWASTALAQHEWDRWCVGNDTCGTGSGQYRDFDYGYGAQVQFTANGPRLAGAVGSSGSGAISDAQGNLLFYTNGIHVYDRLNRLMPGGQNMCPRYDAGNGGTLAAQVVIYPVPGQADSYYLFYFKGDDYYYRPHPLAFAILNYAVVDMRANAGYGAVVQRDMQLATTNLPKMTLVRHANNVDGWLITHGIPERGFRVYRVSSAGVATEPVVSLAGEAAYANSWLLHASPDGQHLVSEGHRPLSEGAGSPIVEHGLYLYDFDNTTGQVSHEQLVWRPAPWDLNRFSLDNYYKIGDVRFFSGASFSPDSRLLYTAEYRVTRDAPTGGIHYEFGTDLVQYDLTQPDATSVQQSRQVLTAGLTFTQVNIVKDRFSGLQLASDGTLWTHDWQELSPAQPFTRCYGPKAMTQIARPNQRGAACDLRLQAFPLGPSIIDPWVLPNVVTNMLFAPTALLAKIDCDSVRLWANSQQTRPPARWDFGDPDSGPANAATGYLVAHRFRRGGLHRVTLTYPDGLVLTKDVEVPAGDADFSAANIITPNGDGQNDVFRPVLSGQVGGGARLRVFSRWGQEVFNAEGPAPDWPAEGIAAGVYFWVLSYADCTGQARQRKGTVTVVR